MQEESTLSKQEEQINTTNENSTEHIYYDIAAELLAKPNALCDILETQGQTSAAIFCNSPSDADFVEVILKKRGIPARKLIGHISPMKVSSSMKQLKEGELVALVVTDVSARGMSLGDFDMVINYTIPSDPEVYIHRAGHPQDGGSPKKVISFVSPLDISNFHYVKKFVDFPLNKGDLPAKEDVFKAKFEKLVRTAKQAPSSSDERLTTMAQMVQKSPDAQSIVAYLLHNSLDVLPNLSVSSSSSFEEEDEEGDSRERRSYRDDRGGRDRDRGRGRSRYRGRDEGDRDYGYDSDNRESSDEGQSSDEDYQPRQNRRESPPQRDTRIYIGHGSSHGFSEDQFAGLINQHCDFAKDQMKRFTLRPFYGFVDFPEEVSGSVIESLKEASLPDGSRLVLIKATSVTSRRESEESEGEGEPISNGNEVQ